MDDKNINNIIESKRYIKKLKNSPTIRNYKNSFKNLNQTGGGVYDTYKKYKDKLKEKYKNYRNQLEDDVKSNYSSLKEKGIEKYKNYRNQLEDDVKSNYSSLKEKGIEKYKNYRDQLEEDVNSRANSFSNYLAKQNKKMSTGGNYNELVGGIDAYAKNLSNKYKKEFKNKLDNKIKELHQYSINNNLEAGLPTAIGKLVLTYGKKQGEHSVDKLGGKIKMKFEEKLGDNLADIGNKLGGKLSDIIKDHVKNYNTKLNTISNTYADKYSSKYNDLMRSIDYSGKYFKKDSELKGGLNSETISDYSNNLTEDEMVSLKMDHNEIITKIKNIDSVIKQLLKDAKSNTISKNDGKDKFKDLLIKRRLLIDTLMNLELKYNSIEQNQVLNDANEKYQMDSYFRSKAKKYGIGFELDDNMKGAFLMNRKLQIAHDTLGDFNKLLSKKLHKQSGGAIFSYEVFISESNIQNGGASKERVMEKINTLGEGYLELIEELKEKQNQILGLDSSNNNKLLEQLLNNVNKINEIVRNIHIFNSRFTNNINQGEIDAISKELDKYEDMYSKYKKDIKVLISNSVIDGGDGTNVNTLKPDDDSIIDFYSYYVLYYIFRIFNNDNDINDRIKSKKCLLNIIIYSFTELNPGWNDKEKGNKLVNLKKLLKLRSDESSIILRKPYQDKKAYVVGSTDYIPGAFKFEKILIRKSKEQEYLPEPKHTDKETYNINNVFKYSGKQNNIDFNNLVNYLK